MKKLVLTSKNITQKQWSNLVLELNLIKKAWKPYAHLELQGPGIKKIIAFGTRVGGESEREDKAER
jgi:hypothetical protein|tara:strand:- start:547 stop:744 length:198 start_codon:yes stop_codon:yes gene_type:complete